MSLTKLWISSPEQFENKQIKQVIAFAGNGRLTDEGDASAQFRGYLSHVPSSFLIRYANECLKEKFDESGFALQDIVNEIGKRLDFEVASGRYRGVKNQLGFDGLWVSKGDRYGLLVEVKTTDAYRIDLNDIAQYRLELIKNGTLASERSSVLIIVGRSDTGDLEAQIRGSRHAWDFRLISVDALFRLLKIKEDVEDPQIIHKVASVLIPREYTKLDSIIDLVFSTAEDVQEEAAPEEATIDSKKPKFVPVSFHEACVRRIEIVLKKKLVKQTRSAYTAADASAALVCAISREHESSGKSFYWYAFHPHQKDFLSEGDGYVALGCGSEKQILLIPFKIFSAWLPKMNMTVDKTQKEKFYWHVHIFKNENKYELHLKSGNAHVDLTQFLI